MYKRQHLDICSRSIAEKLNVTKPSVVRSMNLLMDRGMIVKEHYGKIYLTDRGIFVAVSYTHLDVYKRQLVYHAGHGGGSHQRRHQEEEHREHPGNGSQIGRAHV